MWKASCFRQFELSYKRFTSEDCVFFLPYVLGAGLSSRSCRQLETSSLLPAWYRQFSLAVWSFIQEKGHQTRQKSIKTVQIPSKLSNGAYSKSFAHASSSASLASLRLMCSRTPKCRIGYAVCTTRVLPSSMSSY